MPRTHSVTVSWLALNADLAVRCPSTVSFIASASQRGGVPHFMVGVAASWMTHRLRALVSPFSSSFVTQVLIIIASDCTEIHRALPRMFRCLEARRGEVHTLIERKYLRPITVPPISSRISVSVPSDCTRVSVADDCVTPSQAMNSIPALSRPTGPHHES